jgi:hypothetical protein
MNPRTVALLFPLLLLGCTPAPGVEATGSASSFLSEEDAALDFRLASVEAPSSLTIGVPADVVVRVENVGGTTWEPTAKDRLAAGDVNGVDWSFGPSASEDPDRATNGGRGGYANSLRDARAFLDAPVPPGASAVFRFKIAAPASAAGRVTLAVRMVRDGVTFFGEASTREIAIEVPKTTPPPPAPKPGAEPDAGAKDATVKTPAPANPSTSKGQRTGETGDDDDDDDASDPAKPKKGDGKTGSGAKKKLAESTGCSLGPATVASQPDLSGALLAAGVILTLLGLRRKPKRPS